MYRERGQNILRLRSVDLLGVLKEAPNVMLVMVSVAKTVIVGLPPPIAGAN